MSRGGRVLDGLIAAEAEGRLHHAYILSGPEAPGKMDCIERLAAHFSSARAGGEGAALERIRRGNHPDFLRISPEDGLISVEEVRTLPKALAYAPLEASRRVVVLDGAKGMNVQAANALLKILEEPPGHTMFFLLCREPSELLQTIVSRCQVLRFAPLSGEELLSALGEREIEDKKVLTSWSEGSLARAEMLLQTEDGFAFRRSASESLLALWEASPRIPSNVLQWVEAVDGEEHCQITLDSWELTLRDLAFTAAGAQAKDLYFPEYSARLQALAQNGGAALLDELSSKTAPINRFRVYRKFNGNLRLDFAALVTELQIFSVGKARAR